MTKSDNDQSVNFTRRSAKRIAKVVRTVERIPDDLRRGKRGHKSPRGTNTEPHSWKVTRKDNGATKQITVHPGSIGGAVPSAMFSPIGISGTGTEFVILTSTLLDAVVGASVITVSSTHPTFPASTPNAPPTQAIDVLAVLVDGVVFQIRSIIWRCRQ